MGEHYFTFSRVFIDGQRLCGECRENYEDGDHIEITTLRPYTSYVCPKASGRTGSYGHKSLWTGAYIHSLRTTRDHLCACGAELVEEDKEQWRLTFEIKGPDQPDWHPVSVVRSKHAALSQQSGLLELIDQGELIRNVTLEQVPS